MKRALLPLLATTLFATAVSADETFQQRLTSDARSSGCGYEVLQHLTDHIGPRLSGTPQAEAAVQYTHDQFRSWGFEPTLQPVLVPHWQRGEEKATIVSHFGQRIALTTLGGSVATPASGIEAEVIEVHSFEELDQRSAEVRGKIVLFDKKMNPAMVRDHRGFEAYSEAVPYRSRGASRAAKHGALASLVRSVASGSLRTPHTGSVSYERNVPRIPAAAVSTEDAELIHRLIAQGERVTIRIVLTPQTLPEKVSENVIAEIRGSTRPEEIVVMGGHLDSWDLGTGAVDNGTGVAAVMDALRLIRDSGKRPERTIRAVLFMNEENGLRGAVTYFESQKATIGNHFASIEIDAGAEVAIAINTTVKPPLTEALQPLLSHLRPLGPKEIRLVPFAGADTSPLTSAGVPGFGLALDSLKYFELHHTAADTLDKVDPMLLRENTAALAVLAWELANWKGSLRPAVRSSE